MNQMNGFTNGSMGGWGAGMLVIGVLVMILLVVIVMKMDKKEPK